VYGFSHPPVSNKDVDQLSAYMDALYSLVTSLDTATCADGLPGCLNNKAFRNDLLTSISVSENNLILLPKT